jgi:transposase
MNRHRFSAPPSSRITTSPLNISDVPFSAPPFSAPCRGRPLRFDKDLYRRRNVVERCVGWLKECRAVATRFEKLAHHYLGMVKMAMIQ